MCSACRISKNCPPWLTSLGTLYLEERWVCLVCTVSHLLNMSLKGRWLPKDIAALQVGRRRHFVRVCGEAADHRSVKPWQLLRHVWACSLLCLQPAFCR
jgi:hypothetical protein